MNKAQQWLYDTGFWRVDDQWSWHPRNFRLLFWRTSTGKIHRTYRAVITRLVEAHHAELQQAYQQGAKDAILQYTEYLLQQEGDIPPEQMYVN